MTAPGSAPVSLTPRSPVTVDRRTALRHRILQRCFVRPERVPGDGGWACIAYDISTHGIGVTLPCPLPPGTILHIEPWGLRGASALRARVVRAIPVEFTWFGGCELLVPLGEKELQLWLASPRDWLADTP